MDAPIVSVIIPTFNRKNDLIKAIASVLNQTIQDFEIFILDDASTEDIASVVQQFNDTRILHHRKEEKSNANVLRNIGLRMAKGEFVAFLDSDDEWLNNHLESKISLLKNGDFDGVFGSCFINDGESIKYAGSKAMITGNHPINYLLDDGFAPIPTWVLRTSRAKAISFDETLRRHQDYEYFIMFALRFKWIPAWEPTALVNWQLGVIRQVDFDSEKRFISKYARNIERRLFCQYCYIRFNMWKMIENKEACSYYRGKMLEHIDFITFNQFNQLQQARNKWLFPFRWFNYSALLLVKRFRKKT